jgi:hypothetical protein
MFPRNYSSGNMDVGQVVKLVRQITAKQQKQCKNCTLCLVSGAAQV